MIAGKHRMYRLVFLLLSVFSITTRAQKPLNKELLQEDLNVLSRNLKELHAGLFTYTSEQDFDEWLQNTKSELHNSMDVFEFYKLIAPLNSIIKNGHTQIKYPALSSKFKMLPIQVYYCDGDYYIKSQFDTSDNELVGLRIKQIDGLPIEDIFAQLLKNQTRDGNNLTYPIENLSSIFGLEYSFVFGQREEYSITVYEKNGEERAFTVKAIHLNNEIAQSFNNSPTVSLKFEVIDGIAVITFPTFDTKTLRKQGYIKFLRRSFGAIQKMNIDKLIIDVRNNGGGDPKPTQELLSYLLKDDFVLYEDVYTIANKIEDKSYYHNQGVFWLNTFSWLRVKKINNRRYERYNKEGLKVYKTQPNYYDGDLTVLINGNSFSATGEFTSFLKHYRNTTVFVGEEVGGNRFQNTSGINYTLTLPHSKINVDIPLVVWKLNVSGKQNAHGVIPDYEVRNTINEELTGEDAVMDFALNLNSKKI